MVQRCTTDRCSDCGRSYNGDADVVARTLALHRAERHPDDLLLEAMREVDAMLPHTPPIAPPVRLRPGMSAAPNGHPRCVGPGGCGHYHRRGIPCGQALNERYAAPPPLPTPDVDIFEKISK